MGGAILALGAALSGCRLSWSIEAVSVDAAGTSTAAGASETPVFSPDGTKIAFVSEAADLGPRDTNGEIDVYLHDLGTGQTTLVSVNADGTDSGELGSADPVFSPDGTKIAFGSGATDLGPPDQSYSPDVYVRDLITGTTTLVSRNAAGTGSGNGLHGGSDSPAFSPDGTKIAFASNGDGFGPTDPGTDTDDIDVYLHDLISKETVLVSQNEAGDDGANHSSRHPMFSPDGAGLYFESNASDLGTIDTDEYQDIFRYDVATGTIDLVSVNAAGTGSVNGMAVNPVVAPTGDRIAFVTDAGDLGPTDTNGLFDLYIRDMTTGVTTLVTADATGTDAGNGVSQYGLSFDSTGTKVAFTSAASNLGPTDTNGVRDVYVRDLTTGVTTMVSTKAGRGDSGNGLSVGGGLGRNGDLVLFVSIASNLGPADTNAGWDLYVHDLTTGLTSIVSGTDNEAGDPNGYSRWLGSATFSPDGSAIAFSSIASDLVPIDKWGKSDVFLATVQ